MQPTDLIGYWLARTLRAVAAVVSEAMRAHCAERGKPYVVTPPQYAMLITLVANGELTVSGLGEIQGMETPGVTGIVTRLEQNGLVERVHDTVDRRTVKVSPTQEGRDIVQSLTPLVAALNEKLLPPDETQDLIPQLKALIGRASALTPAKASLADRSSGIKTEEA
jgi:DNA-binding MarR family transcriptional regulator